MTKATQRSGKQTLSNGGMVDWDRPQLMPAPQKGDEHRRATKYPVTCPKCGDERWLKPSDILNRHGSCHVCSLREYRLANPTWSEVHMMQILRGLRLAYAREVRVKDTETGSVYCLDIVLTRWNIAIEVDGWGHKTQPIAERDAMLEKLWGGTTLRFSTDQIRGDWEDIREVIRIAIMEAKNEEAARKEAKKAAKNAVKQSAKKVTRIA